MPGLPLKVSVTSRIDAYEAEIRAWFEKGALNSIADTAELLTFQAAARAMVIEDHRFNLRLSMAICMTSGSRHWK